MVVLLKQYFRILKASLAEDFSCNVNVFEKTEETSDVTKINTSTDSNEETVVTKDSDKLLNPYCHYNTSMNSKYAMSILQIGLI